MTRGYLLNYLILIAWIHVDFKDVKKWERESSSPDIEKFRLIYICGPKMTLEHLNARITKQNKNLSCKWKKNVQLFEFQFFNLIVSLCTPFPKSYLIIILACLHVFKYWKCVVHTQVKDSDLISGLKLAATKSSH